MSAEDRDRTRAATRPWPSYTTPDLGGRRLGLEGDLYWPASGRRLMRIALDENQNILVRLAKLARHCELTAHANRQRANRGQKYRVVIKARASGIEGGDGIGHEIAIDALRIADIRDHEA